MSRRASRVASPDASGPLARIVGIAYRRRTLVILLFLMLSACVWFLGPMLGIGGERPLTSIGGRITAIVALAGLFVLAAFVRRAIAGKRTGSVLVHAFSILMTLTIAGILINSFYKNSVHLAQLSWELGATDWRADRITTFNDRNRADVLRRILPQLNALANLHEMAQTDVEELTGLGFAQAGGLSMAAQSAYRRGLEALLQPLVVRRLEQQLGGGYQDEILYQALQAYLMLHRPERRDAEWVALWLEVSWEQDLPRDLWRDAVRHFEALARYGGPVAIDDRLVSAVRDRLLKVPLSTRVFAAIQSSFVNELPPWRVDQQVGQGALRHFVRTSGVPLSAGVPGLYTAAGYREFRDRKREMLERQDSESWVLGDARADPGSTDRSTLNRELEALYAREFISHWETFINDLNVAPAADLSELSATVGAFSSADSPVKEILRAITEQTGLPEVGSERAGMIAARAEKVLSKLARVTDMARMSSDDATVDARVLVNQHFEPLNRLFDTGSGGPAAIEEALDSLADLDRLLGTMVYASDFDGRLFDAVLENSKAKATMKRVAAHAGRQPAPLKYWLQSVSRIDFLQQAALDVDRTVEHIRSAWQTEILPQCQAMLGNRYPFLGSASAEISLQDFATLFAPGGEFDRFWQAYLEPYADTSSRPWRWQRQRPLSLADGSLAFFERVADIRFALFNGQTRSPRLSMQIKPTTLSAGVNHVLLSNGNQRFRYAHGPIRSGHLDWPSPGVDQAGVVFGREDKADASKRIFTEGPWALFRLFDRAALTDSSTKDGVNLTFDLQGDKAGFLIGQAGSAEFVPSLLAGLRCPTEL